MTVEENIANGCKGKVPLTNWVALCEYWSLDSTKEKALKNAANRANQQNARHTSGSKSFARARYLGVSFIYNFLYIVGHH